jgi:hypothetical protein
MATGFLRLQTTLKLSFNWIASQAIKPGPVTGMWTLYHILSFELAAEPQGRLSATEVGAIPRALQGIIEQ